MSFFSNKVVFFHIDLGLSIFFLGFFRVVCHQLVAAYFVVDLLLRILSSPYCCVFCHRLVAVSSCVVNG